MAGWTKTDYDQFYFMSGEPWGRPGARPSIMLHYHWRSFIRWQESVYAQKLWDALSLNAGDNIVIVGAGFNGTGAGLVALGADVIATDLSDYIQAQKGLTEEAELRAAITAAGLDPDTFTIEEPSCVNYGATQGQLWLDWALEGGLASPAIRGKGQIIAEDMHNRGSRNTIRNALASNPRYGITEEVLNSLSDADAETVCNYAAQFASETGCSIVHILSPFNPKIYQDPALNWKTYKGWRDWLDVRGYQAQKILPSAVARGQGMFQPDLAGFVSYYLSVGMSFEDAQIMANKAIATETVLDYSGLI